MNKASLKNVGYSYISSLEKDKLKQKTFKEKVINSKDIHTIALNRLPALDINNDFLALCATVCGLYLENKMCSNNINESYTHITEGNKSE